MSPIRRWNYMPGTRSYVKKTTVKCDSLPRFLGSSSTCVLSITIYIIYSIYDNLNSWYAQQLFLISDCTIPFIYSTKSSPSSSKLSFVHVSPPSNAIESGVEAVQQIW